ncbi:one cut domain family member 2-like [Penaeus indicus]|uniref:one cut domain family member 2-like n=1 Tax=Penaeus indicus TaxID=29960 RepID=UPI00300D02E5
MRDPGGGSGGGAGAGWRPGHKTSFGASESPFEQRVSAADSRFTSPPWTATVESGRAGVTATLQERRRSGGGQLLAALRRWRRREGRGGGGGHSHAGERGAGSGQLAGRGGN